MAFELREGQGSLFKNENRTSDKHPNARGEILIGGVLYEIAAWTKQGKKGPFQSLQAKPKEQRQKRGDDNLSGKGDRGPSGAYGGRRELGWDSGGGAYRDADDEPIPF